MILVPLDALGTEIVWMERKVLPYGMHEPPGACTFRRMRK